MDYPYQMRRIFFIFLSVSLFFTIAGYTYTFVEGQRSSKLKVLNPIINEIESVDKSIFAIDNTPKSELNETEIISILLLGIDRRSKSELGFRTDTMVNVILNKKTNVALLVSVPRDLWTGYGRINATFIESGWEGLADSFGQITGIKPTKFVLTDFEDFSWVVDAMGGIPVEVTTSFTDSSYPIDATKEYQTVSFVQGREVLSGERALIYARSRKGNNGEGSDWMRMRRQHNILKGMLNAVIQPKSLFNPMNVEKALTMVTQNRMTTNINLLDAEYLWDMYKDKDKYSIESVFLDEDYIFNPPMEEYGGAWVLVSKTDGYSRFHDKISNLLNGIDTHETESNEIETVVISN